MTHNPQKIWCFLSFYFMCFPFFSQNSPQPVQDFSKNPRVYTHRHSFWSALIFNGTIYKNDSNQIKWQYQIEYQHRRIGDASYIKNGEYFNIIKEPSQTFIRPWIDYWLIPGKVRLSINPISHYGAWSPTAEGDHTYVAEFRTCPQITFFQKIGKIDIQQRYRYEQRYISKPQPAESFVKDIFSNSDFTRSGIKGRIRYMIRVDYKISTKTYLSVWNELFIGLGKNVPNNKIFDQNRLIMILGKKYGQAFYPIRIEMGFMWQLIPRYDITVPPTQDPSYGSYEKNNWESNLALQVWIIFEEFHKIFHLNRDKKEQ